MKKTVYHFDENGNQTTEQKECHPRTLSFTSRNIDPYWYKAILNVLNYQKRRVSILKKTNILVFKMIGEDKEQSHTQKSLQTQLV